MDTATVRHKNPCSRIRAQTLSQSAKSVILTSSLLTRSRGVVVLLPMI
jgi:hypothetical protein